MEELAAAAEALTTDGGVGLVGGSPELPPLGRVHVPANGGYIANEDVTAMTLDTEENRAALAVRRRSVRRRLRGQARRGRSGLGR